MTNLPKFLIADSSELEEAIFIVHTEYPRFFLNVLNDEIQMAEVKKVTSKNICKAEGKPRKIILLNNTFFSFTLKSLRLYLLKLFFFFTLIAINNTITQRENNVPMAAPSTPN